MTNNYLPEHNKSNLKKDYQKNEFVNPYFDHGRHKQKFNTKLYLKILLVILIVYLVVYSDLLKIEAIEIDGLDMIDNQEFQSAIETEIKRYKWYIFPQDNVLFLNKHRLKQVINNKYHLKDLEIAKDWKKLSIQVTEKPSHLIVYNIVDKKFYFIDLDGIVMNEINRGEVANYWEKLPILNLNQEKIILGNKLLTGQAINYILNIHEKLKYSPVVIQGYEKGEGENDLNLVAKDGWRAYLNINSDPEEAIDNLLLVVNDKKNELKDIQYFDLRFGNKVFYK